MGAARGALYPEKRKTGRKMRNFFTCVKGSYAEELFIIMRSYPEQSRASEPTFEGEEVDRPGSMENLMAQ